MPLEKQWKFEDSFIWKLKLKLQFSGWLQYIIHPMWILALLIIAAIGWLISLLVGGELILFWLPFVLALLLTIALVGTILIVKYGLHPSEKIPASKYNLEVFDIISSRRSCRSFQSRDLAEEHREKLLKVVKFYSQLNQLLGDKQIRFEYIKSLSI